MTAARMTFATPLLAVILVATGCGTEPLHPAHGPMPAHVPVYEYTQTQDGYRLRQVSVKAPERFEGQTSATSDAMRAVAALLDHRPASEHWHNLWNGDCAPGQEVTDVKITQNRVTVHLDGRTADTCKIVEEALEAGAQQIAWTLIVNFKEGLDSKADLDLVRPPFPEIVVQDGSGATMDPIRADDSYLPSVKDY